MGVLERWSVVAVRACRLVSPAGKSYRAALSPSFSTLVDTNVWLDSLDDLSICDEVYPLRQMPHRAGHLCGPRAMSGLARFAGRCAELLGVALYTASSLQQVSLFGVCGQFVCV